MIAASTSTIRRGVCLLLVTFTCVMAVGDTFVDADALGTRISPDSLSSLDVQEASLAWKKLLGDTMDGPVRRAAVKVSEEKGGGHQKGDAKGGPRSLFTEYTLDAESSFTAVSRALDALANQTRDAEYRRSGGGGGDGPHIARNIFVVEGSNIDKESVKSYLNSKHASEALANSEANALRRVMAMLLEANSTNANGGGSSGSGSGSGSVVHARFGRSAANPDDRPASNQILYGHRRRHDQRKPKKSGTNKKGSRFSSNEMLHRKGIIHHEKDKRRDADEKRELLTFDKDKDDTLKVKGGQDDNIKNEKELPPNNSKEKEDQVLPSRNKNFEWRKTDSFASQSMLRGAYADTGVLETARNMRYGYGGGLASRMMPNSDGGKEKAHSDEDHS